MHLSVNIKRGNVKLTGDLIDDSVSENRHFIEKRLQGKVKSIPGPQPDSAAPSQDAGQDIPGPRMSLLDIKTRAQIAKYKEEIDLLKAKKEKLFEEQIPREHAVHLVVAQSEGLKGAWLRATKTFITQFSAMHNLPKEDMVHWERELTNLVNETVEHAVSESKKNLRRIAREFAGKKGKGEKND